MKKYLDVLLILLVFIPQFSYASNTELSKDLKSIEKISMIKDELETTAEFNARVNELYARYKDKQYELNIDINSPLFSEHKYLTYNADTSVLTVSLPRLESKLLWVEENGDTNIKYIFFSFIQTEESDIKTSKYVARNGLGQEVTVTKVNSTSNGVAILGRSNPDLIPQRFNLKMNRDQVRGVLKKGRIVLILKSDLQKLEKEPSLFLTDKDTHEPNMRNPVEAISVK